jgi:integrase
MLNDIGPQLVENYKAKRKADITPRKTIVTEATINREIALLKTIFNKAVEWGKIDVNRLAKVKKFKENHNKDMRILKDHEAIRLINSANSHLKPILIIALNTGMRRGEILSLKWEHVNFKKGLIFIKNSKSGDREIPMNYMVFETLKELPQDHEYVFFNPKTETHIKDVKNSFKVTCKNANINSLRFHDLRHSAASRMIQAGVDLVTVSRILGHSSIQMTMRYIHTTTEIMRDAVEKLAKIYDQTRQKVDTPTEEVKIQQPVTQLKSGH